MVKKLSIVSRVLSLLKRKSKPVSNCVSCHGTGQIKMFLGHGIVMKRACWCLGDDSRTEVER